MIRFQIIKFIKVKSIKDLKLNGWATKKIGVHKMEIATVSEENSKERVRDIVDTFFLMLSFESFLYNSGFKFLIEYVIYKYFRSLCSLCFHSFTQTFAEQKF